MDPSASSKKNLCLLCEGSFNPFNPCLNLLEIENLYNKLNGIEIIVIVKYNEK